VRRKTIRKRMRAKLRQIMQQLRQRMHDPVRWLIAGFLNRACSISTPRIASPPVIRDKSRMR